MRSYIPLEKEFIQFLVDAERGQRKLTSFLDKYLEKTKIIIDIENKEAEFKFEVEGGFNDEIFEWVIKNVGDLEEIIAVLVNLIKSLEKIGYIAPYKVTPEENTKVWRFGKGVEQYLKMSSPFPDREIVRFLIDYLFKEIIALQPLKDFVKHDFVTPEERRFRKQYIIAIMGIALSMLIGISAIILNILSQNSFKNSAKESNSIVNNAVSALDRINLSINDTSTRQIDELESIGSNVVKTNSNIELHFVKTQEGIEEVTNSVNTSTKTISYKLKELYDLNNRQTRKDGDK